ncbi:Yip1 family protein [Propionivibrio sp.]|uniref:Yip1 family protein n=1 Tax=Propionivibrio sp. TaxID=2212460 RepID=UPI003BF27B02
MNLVQRVKDILLTPKQTWPVIEAEPADTATLYTQYLMLLALIPAIAGFIGMSLIGVNAMGMSMRIPLLSGLVNMIVGYVLSLVMVYVLALIADALAPTFGGQKNPIMALKLVVFGSTAGMIGGIFSVIPALSMLGLLAALYSIYLLFLGIPVLMKAPPEKALPYTAVLLVCGVIAGAVIGAVTQLVTPGPSMQIGAGGQAPMVSIDTPQGTVKLDVTKMDDWSKRMEEAGKKLEKAQQSGDQAAMEKAMKEMAALHSPVQK